MPIEKLRGIIAPEVLISLNTEHERRMSLTIKEDDPAAKLKEVRLTGFESATVAFRLDHKGKRVSEFINAACKNINKGCDAIIITSSEGNGYIFICELKSESPKGYREQMLASSAFVKYLNAMLDNFFGLTLGKFKIKYILFYKKRINKRRLRHSAIPPEKKQKGRLTILKYPNPPNPLNIKSIMRYFSNLGFCHTEKL